METNALAPPNLGQSEPSPPLVENGALSPENLQAAIAKLFNQGTPSSQIAQELLNTFPQYYQMGMNTLSLLQFQADILESVKTSFEPHYSYVFDLLYQSLLWNNPDRLLDICATHCNRRDYAFCEVAVDYIEKNYEPSWYELKALRNKLYKTYRSGASPSAILAVVTSKNQKFRQLAETIAEIAVEYPVTISNVSLASTASELPRSRVEGRGSERTKTSHSDMPYGRLRERPLKSEPIKETLDYWLEDDSISNELENDESDLLPEYPGSSELQAVIDPDISPVLPNYSKVVNLNPEKPVWLDTVSSHLSEIKNLPSDSNTISGQPKNTLLTKYEEKNLVGTVASLSISTLVTAPSGTGKTTFSRAYIQKYYQLHPDATFYICAAKNDFWLGMRNIPGVCAISEYDEQTTIWDFSSIVNQIKKVLAILNQRRQLTESSRENLPRVILLLDDYYFMWNIVYKGGQVYSKVRDFLKTALGTIITLGREVGVVTTIFTQSYNLESLGLSDANVRDNLAILVFGNVVQTESGEQGTYEVLSKVLDNRFIVGNDSTRVELSCLLNQLIPVSRDLSRPIAFSSIGAPTLMFLQDYRWSKDCRLSDSQLDAIAQRFGCVRNVELN